MKDFSALKKIGEKLLDADSMLLFPHIHADGDALGSAVALCKVLRGLGKNAYVLMEDSIADNLKFLDNGYCTFDGNIIKEPQLCICIDCADIERFVERKDAFLRGRETMCIDHHRTTKVFADHNYLDPDASATGAIIYDLLKLMEWPIDREMGEAIFAAITTDTGNFQYSNTTKHDHEIVTELYDVGIDFNKVSIEIYENVSLNKLRLDNEIMNTLEIFADGRGAVSYVTQDMINNTHTCMNDTEGTVGKLRSIQGVEISVFLKERGENEIYVSLRAKTVANVAEISEEFGGGGHIKAAGCTLRMPLPDAKALILDRVNAQLVKLYA